MKFSLCTAVLFVSPLAGFAQEIHRTPLADDTSSVVEVTSVFSLVPPSGYAPLRVKAVNDTTTERTITIRNTSRAGSYYSGAHELESSFSLTAAANKTTEREFMVPLCQDTGRSYYGNAGSLSVITSTGTHSDRFNVPTGTHDAMPFAAFSKALAGRTIQDLNTASSSIGSSSRYSNSTFAALYDASLLPPDWRGYSGLDVLAITTDEWSALQPGVKTAVLQWVRLGGTLDIYAKAGAPGLEALLGIKVHGVIPGLRLNVTARHALGLGSVCTLTWDGRELDGTRANDYHLWPPVSLRRHEAAESFRGGESSVKWIDRSPLVEALGEKNFAAWQVGLILFIFGIMVGPVNLFYFARAGRRHRLFYTTPIISVAAAALLLVVIFFQDGTGGTGHRSSVVYLDAAENSAFVHQLQVSRTGVLFGGSFSTEDNAVVGMAVLPESRWTRLKSHSGGWGRGGRSEAQRYTVSGNSFAGDWFQSRTEQAQIIDAVQSTRGRLSLVSAAPGGAPVISSTLIAPLERLCYIDATGNHWVSPGEVTTGAQISMRESSEADFLAWRREAAGMLHKDLRDSLAGPGAGAGEKGFFYAASSDSRAGTVATLASIDWQSDRVFLYGPLTAQ
jgi:hypothetical protein